MSNPTISHLVSLFFGESKIYKYRRGWHGITRRENISVKVDGWKLPVQITEWKTLRPFFWWIILFFSQSFPSWWQSASMACWSFRRSFLSLARIKETEKRAVKPFCPRAQLGSKKANKYLVSQIRACNLIHCYLFKHICLLFFPFRGSRLSSKSWVLLELRS